MKVMSFPEQTSILGAPAEWNEKRHGECVGLPVLRERPYFHSYWKPSLKEIFTLILGGKIRLSIMGDGHPVVSLNAMGRKQL